MKIAGFSITPDGEILYKDGYEQALPKIEVLANGKVKKKRDIHVSLHVAKASTPLLQ